MGGSCKLWSSAVSNRKYGSIGPHQQRKKIWSRLGTESGWSVEIP